MTAPEQRLAALENRRAIEDLQIAYVRHLDAGDFAAHAALFAADGQLMLGPAMGRATGPAQIEAMMTRLLVERVGSYIHLVSNPAVRLDGDRADGEVRWTSFLRAADGTPRLDATGRHLDDYVLQDGRWLFARRRGFVDLPAVFDPLTGTPARARPE